ncbi:MAG: MOSC domain-containing protein [Candidatus Phaeomarinobacter sp.]
MSTQAPAKVLGVYTSTDHSFSKQPVDEIELVAGLGVAGDCHKGAQVKHRSRVAADPTQPNLRQVHLMHTELFAELHPDYEIKGGDLGENITTQGIDILSLPTGATLKIGETALIAITGLRNPCQQIEAFRPGLLKRVAHKNANGQLVRKAGVMGVVVLEGIIRPGDGIDVTLPPKPHVPLERV